MKCPKCEYLGFEPSDRCRNCGYDFSLIGPDPAGVASGDPAPAGAAQLLTSPESPLEPALALDLERIFGGAPEDLPLFSPQPESDTRSGAGTPASRPPMRGTEPLITTAGRPRPPLGVRRATPEIPRARSAPPRGSAESLFDAASASEGGRHVNPERALLGGRAAAPFSRILAAALDASILLGLNGGVLYFTLRLCGLTGADVLQLPAVPLLAFFLLLDGGYFVAFTGVGGQSIGKMALGIKVVDDQDRPIHLGRATLRTIAYLASALPFGAGFLPGVLGSDRLALHDRLAHTRVVRPSAP